MTLSFIYSIIAIAIFLWLIRLKFKAFERIIVLSLGFMALSTFFDFQSIGTMSSIADPIEIANIFLDFSGIVN